MSAARAVDRTPFLVFGSALPNDSPSSLVSELIREERKELLVFSCFAPMNGALILCGEIVEVVLAAL